MKYELETLYEAFVDSRKCSVEGCHRMHFRFFHCENADVMEIRDAYDTEWKHYGYDAGTLGIDHKTDDGTWVFRITAAAEGTWLYWQEGRCYTPKVSRVSNDDKHFNNKMKGIPHQYLIEDNMEIVSSVSRPEAIKKCVKAYAKMMTADPFRRGIFTNITEGGNEMDRRLYHVILFNKKTENIDFKEYIVAGDETDASMQAAQAYGKYSSFTHVTIVKYIEGSDYEVEK